MAGVRTVYDIDVKQPLQAMQAVRGLDPRLLADEIGDYVLSETLFNFQDEQTPEGEPWEPSQRALDENGKTLQDRGHLRDSYTYVVSLAGDQVEIGSNMIYAAIHHFGGEAGRNKAVTLPARPALGITPAMEQDIGDMALAFYGRPLGF